ncbi:hypothetical protein B0T24DRAFT_538699 [Lasiosphaeria ovina]|uniref:C2H2-type domain-containing protein n=1 Tax=Lasiosphaeria ovina TaxID=92902 RepID=A0AAE0MY76_9PEZI|nr:hypothetical protein B0T24DRAFT_538699 [Lasiosphaeria ovina]
MPFHEQPAGDELANRERRDQAGRIQEGSVTTGPFQHNSDIRTETKRRRSGGDLPSDEDSDGERPTRAPSRAPVSRLLLPRGKKLACPFRKHDQVTYSLAAHRSCAASSWGSVHRVKEHLYRCHLPIYCPRCKAVFKTKTARDNHLNVEAAAICQAQDCLPEGMTNEQETQLRSKKRMSRAQTEEDKWCNVYVLLFPNEAIPSPYFEPVETTGSISPKSHSFQECEGFVRRQVPLLVHDTILEMARLDMQRIEEHLLNSLPGIIQDCVATAFTQYRETRQDAARDGPEQIQQHLSSRDGLESELGNDVAPVAGDVAVPQLTAGAMDNNAELSATGEGAMPMPLSLDFLDALYGAPPSLEEDTVAMSFPELRITTSDSTETDSGYTSGLICSICNGDFCVCSLEKEAENDWLRWI